MPSARQQAQQIVKTVVKMYAPRGTNTRESAAITRFIMLTCELECAIRGRATGQRDMFITTIALFLQQHAV